MARDFPGLGNIFAVNVLRMWEKRGFTSHAGVLHPNEPVSQWIIPEKKANRVRGRGWGVRTYFFEIPLGVLGFCFTHENSKENKPSPLETPQNCITPHRKFKV